jgi:hypothetical protein
VAAAALAAVFSSVLVLVALALVPYGRRHLTPNRICALSFAAAIPLVAVPGIYVAVAAEPVFAAPLAAVAILCLCATVCFAPSRGRSFNRFEREFWSYVDGGSRSGSPR